MDPWLLVSLAGGTCLVTLALGVVGVWFVTTMRRRGARQRRDRAIEAAVREAATALDFEEVSPHVYEGRVRGRRMRWTLREVDHDVAPRLQLAFGTPVAAGQLALTHRSMIYGVEPEPSELPLVKIGDPAFDVRFHIHADLEHLSLLQAPVRRIVLDASAGALLRVRNEWIWLDHNATLHLVEVSRSRMEALIEAAAVFDQVQIEVEQRVRRLSQDPVARVRLNVLDQLAARGSSEFTGWIAQALSEDADPSVRVRAAEIQRHVGRLAAMAVDQGLSRDLRRMAAMGVGTHGTVAQRIDLANALVRGPNIPPEVALDLCSGHEAAAESVIIELVQSVDASIARRAVNLLGEIGSARSLVILQALVEHDDAPMLLRLEGRKALAALRSQPFRRSPLPAARRTPVPVQGRSATPLHGLTPSPADRLSARAATPLRAPFRGGS